MNLRVLSLPPLIIRPLAHRPCRTVFLPCCRVPRHVCRRRSHPAGGSLRLLRGARPHPGTEPIIIAQFAAHAYPYPPVLYMQTQGVATQYVTSHPISQARAAALPRGEGGALRPLSERHDGGTGRTAEFTIHPSRIPRQRVRSPRCTGYAEQARRSVDPGSGGVAVMQGGTGRALTTSLRLGAGLRGLQAVGRGRFGCVRRRGRCGNWLCATNLNP